MFPRPLPSTLRDIYCSCRYIAYLIGNSLKGWPLKLGVSGSSTNSQLKKKVSCYEMLHTVSGWRVLPNTVMDFHKRRGIFGLYDYLFFVCNKYVTYKASLANYQIIPASQSSSLSHEFTFIIYTGVLISP